MTDDSFTRCPACGQQVDPDGNGVGYAVQILRLDTMRGPTYHDGMGGFFHPGCDASVIGWSPRPKP